ncbi:hypothetical protein [Actinophytocola oryzae]|uniref:DUF1449 family protein n=1 Tax=Actinophytocola oryzae TaxID=502181 RepID=A0A4R7VCZ1_9PSEU|nr:hypothetical protein [Actinophytocola oryzae]TDV46839.1 hypothetical protein CLV71_11019 [Actinophytocola oryzae]
MGDFVGAALSYPAVILTALLVVVVLYWLLVLVGTLDVELGDADVDLGFGLGGVPVTVTVSILTVVAWFVGLTGTVLIDGLGSPLDVIMGMFVLLVAVAAGLVAARLAAPPLRRLYVPGGEASRGDFVGRVCVIRTGRVTGDFGQAEVAAADGSSAIVQVRQTGEHELANGHRALIFDYDIDGEFFWVAPA